MSLAPSMRARFKRAVKEANVAEVALEHARMTLRGEQPPESNDHVFQSSAFVRLVGAPPGGWAGAQTDCEERYTDLSRTGDPLFILCTPVTVEETKLPPLTCTSDEVPEEVVARYCIEAKLATLPCAQLVGSFVRLFDAQMNAARGVAPAVPAAQQITEVTPGGAATQKTRASLSLNSRDGSAAAGGGAKRTISQEADASPLVAARKLLRPGNLHSSEGAKGYDIPALEAAIVDAAKARDIVVASLSSTVLHALDAAFQLLEIHGAFPAPAEGVDEATINLMGDILSSLANGIKRYAVAQINTGKIRAGMAALAHGYRLRGLIGYVHALFEAQLPRCAAANHGGPLVVHPCRAHAAATSADSELRLPVTARHKLLHDAEQLEHILLSSMFDTPRQIPQAPWVFAISRKEWAPGLLSELATFPPRRALNETEILSALELYENAIKRSGGNPAVDLTGTWHWDINGNTPRIMTPENPRGDRVVLSHAVAQELQTSRVYHHGYHEAAFDNLDGPLINPNLDVAEIVRAFEAADPRIAIVDDFLTPRGLELLRKHAHESRMWHAIKPAYLGAYLDHGLAHELVRDHSGIDDLHHFVLTLG